MPGALQDQAKILLSAIAAANIQISELQCCLVALVDDGLIIDLNAGCLAGGHRSIFVYAAADEVECLSTLIRLRIKRKTEMIGIHTRMLADIRRQLAAMDEF